MQNNDNSFIPFVTIDIPGVTSCVSFWFPIILCARNCQDYYPLAAQPRQRNKGYIIKKTPTQVPANFIKF